MRNRRVVSSEDPHLTAELEGKLARQAEVGIEIYMPGIYRTTPAPPCHHTEMPPTRLEELKIVARFRDLSYTPDRCDGCGWWKVWRDTRGNMVETFTVLDAPLGI